MTQTARMVPASQNVWVLENDVWRLEVLPRRGGQIGSMVYKPLNDELLRVPEDDAAWDAAPYLYGIPLLFPPGRIVGGEFMWRGRTYRWPQNDAMGPNHLHGFVYRAAWDVVEAGDREMTLRLGADAAARVAEHLGSAVALWVRYALDGGVLVEVAVENAGDAPIPFGFGFHTAWRVDRHDWRVTIPAGREWVMGSDGAPAGRFQDRLTVLEGLSQGRTARSIVADTCYRVDDGVVPRVALAHAERPVTIYAAGDEAFRHLVVFRPEVDSPFLCIEPYTWTHNAVNLPLSPAVTGLDGLEPHAVRRLRYRISDRP